MNQEKISLNIIEIPANTPSDVLKEILEEIPELHFIELHFQETGLSIRGLKQNNQIMLLFMKDPKDNYKRNDGWKKMEIHVCLDIDKLQNIP